MQKKTIHVTDLIAPLINEDNFTRINSEYSSFAYHKPCHLNLLDKPNSTVDVLKKLDGVNLVKLSDSCCGMAGSWGMASKNYDLSVKIGSKMFDNVLDDSFDVGVTDCPTCSIQMEHLTKQKVLNPIEVIDKCIK